MSVTLTNLKAQVQARINAATSAASLKDLLILRKAAEGLGCDESNLDTLMSAKIAAMGGTTELKDLLIGNKASVTGGSQFKPSFFSGTLEIPAGVTGEILTLTAPAGKKVMLTSLLHTTTGGPSTDISVSNEEGVVVSSKALASSAESTTSEGTFIIGFGNTGRTAGGGSGVLPYVIGNTITVSKAGGDTSQPIKYSYTYGE